GATVVTERADAPGTRLRQYDFRKTGLVVERLSNGPSIIFYPSGRSASPTTITLESRRHEQWRLTVSLTGRIATL
ncbi:MAG: GspH/FimT family protein, partial [Nitrospirae bacterium]|nr:GspH/FimT family protein [Nitrospirota bacterium]